MKRTHVFPALLVLACMAGATATADTNPYLRGPEERRWTPVADDVYLQERAEQIETSSPVRSVAAHGGRIFAVMDGRIHEIADGALQALDGSPAEVERVLARDGALWSLGGAGLHRRDGGAWTELSGDRPADLCVHLGAVHAAIGEHVYRVEGDDLVNIEPEGGYRSSNLTFEMEDGTQILRRPVTWGKLERIASYSETVYGLRSGDMVLFNGEAIDPAVADWGNLPSKVTRDMTTLGSRLFVSTNRGLGVLRGMSLTEVRGTDGLPYEDTTCLVEGFDQDLWIGTTTGAIRMTDGDFHYFGRDHWLPGDNVHDIAVDGHSVYVACDGGVGVIHYEPYTLAKKAAYYERYMQAWGMNRMGFVHKLYWSGAEDGWVREISDNDGAKLGHALAAYSFKYAVTGEPADRALARDAFEAMIWLEAITPVSGFIARSIWSLEGDAGQQGQHGSGGLPAKWWPTDDGLWEWKGDTSSDEVNAHYYAMSIYHDLVAEGAEKERAAEHITRITDHIIENGWLLRDMDGEPTRWGRWDPEYLQRPYGNYARGLNGMEAQMYAITAREVSGDDKYQKALEQLIDWGYHKHTVRQKLTFPRSYSVPWDDHLAFNTYYPMLKYATDPHLRSIYQRSLARSWEVKRLEHVAWYNFIYGAATGNDCETGPAVDHLREFPLDCTSHSYYNSHRQDFFEQPGYTQYGSGPRPVSPRESEVKFSSRNSFKLDSNSGGRSAIPPIAWLEDYWMGRYYGFIEPPTATDPELIAVEPWDGVHRGAAPYEGPERPDNLAPKP